MNLAEYQPLAAATMNAELDETGRAVNCALGLMGEIAELAEAIYPAKLGYGQKRDDFSPEDRDYILKEIGDMAGYSAVLADAFGRQLTDVVKFDLSLPPTFKADQGWNIAWSSFQKLLQKSGFVAGQVKWYAYHGHELTDEVVSNVMDTLVDVIWQLHQLAFIYGGVTLTAVLDQNIEKLRSRYPDGVFTTEASVNRVD